jgi:hypothetical protein
MPASLNGGAIATSSDSGDTWTMIRFTPATP